MRTRKPKNFVDIGLIIIAIALFLAIAYGGWRAKRYLNWELQYADEVEIMIMEKVKEECLI